MNLSCWKLRKRVGHRAFSLLEVMIACLMFFMAIFAILAMVSSSLRNGRSLRRMDIDAGFDHTTEIATGDVTFERGGVVSHFQIRERYFSRDEIAATLGATGFAIEQEEAWSPFPVGGLGKAWWSARLG